ncbi:2529_t:CDS:1 [Dentiscutata heterogama]|uniref:2529_t:CDS:1 n=1 Tax=Dentiscutata heterogama TaxID=1316150 RepID=A0ACA9NSY4_9GLOM|nr:2529_t:CDS:1 [Dentiscutata heterogama]
MDEATRRKYCGLLMFDVSPPSLSDKSINKIDSSTQLTIDHTTSLENSSIRTQDNFVFTSFLEPIRVRPQSPIKNKPTVNNDVLDSNSSIMNNDKATNLSNFEKLSPEDRTPRPPNAFILYRRAKQPEVTRDHGNISNSKISKILATLWRNEDDDVKHYWQKMADRKKMEHMLAHPGYVYRPKKPSENKKKKDRRKLKATTQECEEPSIPTPAPNPVVSPQESESIIPMDPTSFPYEDQFENYSQITPTIFHDIDLGYNVYSIDYNYYNDYNDYNFIETNGLQYLIDQNDPFFYENNIC